MDRKIKISLAVPSGFLVLFVLSTMGALSQTISDCEGGVVLCGDLYTETEATLNTGDFYEYTGACNANLEQSSVWYTFTVQEDGLLSFILDPINPMDDYDWGLFDITSGGCEGVGSPILSPEVGCNSYGVAAPTPNGPTGISTANGGTGASNGPGNLNGPAFNADLPVLAGEEYALVVMNWTNSLEGYTTDFGQSTASLYDQWPPQPDSIGVDCTLNDFVGQLDEFVLVSTVEAADFELVGPGSNSYGFAGLVPLDQAGDLASLFSMTISSPIINDGLHQLFIIDVAGSVADPCGNLGEGFAAIDLTRLDPPNPWDEWMISVCPDDVANLWVDGVVMQPTSTAYEYEWIYTASGGSVTEQAGDGAGIESIGDGLYTVIMSTVPPCYEGSGSYLVVTEQCSLTVPNVISPDNGDALNDAFLLDGLDAWPGSAVRIFDRWGVMMYSSDNFGATAGWDPSQEEATEGTYWYEIRIPIGLDNLTVIDIKGETNYSGADNPIATLTGSFQLLR